jgi:hypothetical protein
MSKKLFGLILVCGLILGMSMSALASDYQGLLLDSNIQVIALDANGEVVPNSNVQVVIIDTATRAFAEAGEAPGSLLQISIFNEATGLRITHSTCADILLGGGFTATVYTEDGILLSSVSVQEQNQPLANDGFIPNAFPPLSRPWTSVVEFHYMDTIPTSAYVTVRDTFFGLPIVYSGVLPRVGMVQWITVVTATYSGTLWLH